LNPRRGHGDSENAPWHDIAAGRVDLVVVYKIDRLSRSLSDFIRLIEALEKYGASFVSVTQTFDTSDTMGRLVLNILLTFAQFERELAGDRARDKKAALMRRGLYVGGTPPFGYILERGGRLATDPERAPLVREMFERFPSVTASELVRDFASRGCRTRRYRTKAGVERGGQASRFRLRSAAVGGDLRRWRCSAFGRAGAEPRQRPSPRESGYGAPHRVELSRSALAAFGPGRGGSSFRSLLAPPLRGLGKRGG